MKRLIGIAALLLGLPLAAAQAQDDPFMLDDQYAYWGAELGNAQLQDVENVCATCDDDLGANSYTLKFGFAFTKYLGIEARYLALNNIPSVSGGSASTPRNTTTNPNTPAINNGFFEYHNCGSGNGICTGGRYEASFDYNSFGGAIKGRYPLLPNVNVTGSFGRHFWNWNSEFTYTHFDGDYFRVARGEKRGGTCQLGANYRRDCTRDELATLLGSRRGDDWTYGAGAEIHFGPNLQGELSYNRMGGEVFHINNYSVGLALQF